MAEISNRLRERNVSIVQHYFASYHGSGPADAVASHLKRKIKVTREEFHKNPQTVQDMARICSSIANTDKAAALVMPTDLLDAESHVEVRTLAGIKSYHKVSFTGQQTVSLWLDSLATEIALTKVLNPTGVLV